MSLPKGWSYADTPPPPQPSTLPPGWKFADEEETPGNVGGVINAARRAGRNALATFNVTQAIGATGKRDDYLAEAERLEKDAERINELQPTWSPENRAAWAERARTTAAQLRDRAGTMEDSAGGFLKTAAEQTEKAAKIPLSEDYQRYQQAEGWDAVVQFLKNPVEIPTTIAVEGAVGSVPALAMGALGAAGGGPAGMAVGLGAGSFATEYAGSVLDTLNERGVPTDDPQALREAFANEELMAEARKRATARGVPVAAFDALSAGLAGRTISGAAKKGVREIAKQGAKEIAEQAGLGMGGETAGQISEQVATTGKVDLGKLRLKDIAAEGIGEIVPGAGEVAMGASRRALSADTGRNVPERRATLEAQQEQLVAGRRPAQMFPTGTEELPLPEGMERVQTQRGVFHFNPALITADEVQAKSAAGRENDLLALGDYSKADLEKRGEPIATVTERTPDGIEVKAAVATPSTAAAITATLEKTKTPGNQVQVEPVTSVLADRGSNFVNQLAARDEQTRRQREEAEAKERAEREARFNDLQSRRERFNEHRDNALRVWRKPDATFAEVQGALEAIRFYAEENSLGLEKVQKDAARKAAVSLEKKLAMLQPAEDARREEAAAALKAERDRLAANQAAERAAAKKDFRQQKKAGIGADGRVDYTAIDDDALAERAQQGDQRAERELMRRASTEGDARETLLAALAAVKLPANDAKLGSELSLLINENMDPRQRRELVGKQHESLDATAEALRERGFTQIQTPGDVIDFVERALRGEDIRAERSDTVNFGAKPERKPKPPPAGQLTEKQAKREIAAIRKAFPELTREYDIEVGMIEDALRRRGYRGPVPAEVEAAVMRNKAQRNLIVLGVRAYRDRAKGAALLTHEVAHTYWDTLPEETRDQLRALHRREVQNKSGPLYRDGVLQSELDFVEDLDERGHKEWFAERIARLNEAWAKGEIDRTEYTVLQRVAAELREIMRRIWETLATREKIDPDSELFVQEFRRFFAAGADQNIGRAAGAAYAQRNQTGQRTNTKQSVDMATGNGAAQQSSGSPQSGPIEAARQARHVAAQQAQAEIESARDSRLAEISVTENDTFEPDELPSWRVGHRDAKKEWTVYETPQGWMAESDGSWLMPGSGMAASASFPSREAAVAAAREDIAQQIGIARGSFGIDMDASHAIAPIFDHFALPPGATETGWMRTKWGSWYNTVTLDDETVLKLSVRDHAAVRRDMGLPDISFEIASKDWTPASVAKGIDYVEAQLWEKANAASDEASGVQESRQVERVNPQMPHSEQSREVRSQRDAGTTSEPGNPNLSRAEGGADFATRKDEEPLGTPVTPLPKIDRRAALLAELKRGRELASEGNRTGNDDALREGTRLTRLARERLDDEFPGWENAAANPPPPTPPDEVATAAPDDGEPSPFTGEGDEPMPVRPGRFNEVYGHDAIETTALARTWRKAREVLAGIRGSVPELPTFPHAAWNRVDNFIKRHGATFYNPAKEFLRTLRAGNDYVQRTAEEQVANIVRPLLAAGGDFSAGDYAALRRAQELARKKRASGETVPPSLTARISALNSKLESSPYVLFNRLVLTLDLKWRHDNLKDSEGNAIALPANVNAAELSAELQRLAERLESSPHAALIKRAIEQHMQLVKQTADDLKGRELLADEHLANPYYFPHITLETTRGGKTEQRELRPQRVKPGTEADFRGYLITPVGSSKPISTDYVRSMYYHLVQVGAHNWKADAVREVRRVYDIKRQVEETAKKLSRERGVPVSWEQAFHEQFADEGYVLYGTDSRDAFPQVTVNRDALARRLGVMLTSEDLHTQLQRLGLRGIKLLPEDLQETMQQGAKETWIIPARVAEALRGIADRESRQDNALEAALKSVQGAWKAWKLFMPQSHIRYEYGNMVADLEKLFSAAPRTFRFMPDAAKEVRQFWLGATPSADLRAAIKEGVINTITAQELDALQRQAAFRDFETWSDKLRAEVKAAFSAPLANLTRLFTPNGVLGRVTSVEESAFREAVFRYAKFKADLDAMRHGARPEYAGAYWRDIDAMGDSAPGAGDALARKAGAISKNTFGDYGDLSVTGSWLRDKLIPFYSWTEINFRYHANVLRNLRDMVRAGEASQADARKAGARAAAVFAVGFTSRAAGGVMLRLALPYLAVALWNNTGDREELEKLLSEEDRRRFHIILGKDDDGRVQVIYGNTALMDVARWFSGPKFVQAMAGWIGGKTDFPTAFSEWADEIVPDFINNTVGSTGPVIKVPYTFASKKNPFPDVLDQRTVPSYDMRRVILSQLTDEVTADAIERTVSKDYYGSKDVGDWAKQLVLQVRKRDPEAWAFYEIKDKAADFVEKRTGRKRDSSFDAPDQQVLRNFRRAIYRGDVDKATQFYLRLLDYGYTADRFAASIRSQHPLAELPKELRQPFVDSLSEFDRQQLDRAMRYYEKIGALRGRERQLFPTKRAGAAGVQRFQAAPRTDRFRSLMDFQSELAPDQLDAMIDRDLNRSLMR